MACSVEEMQDGLSALSGRWKLIILFQLFASEAPLRFSALERAIPNVTQKMLSQQLRALEHDGLVERIVFDVVPPHVEYRLSALGRALEPALEALLRWSQKRARLRAQS